MQHLTFKASVTEATDQGTFTALASAWDADREGDVIAKNAFDKTIAAWQQSASRAGSERRGAAG